MRFNDNRNSSLYSDQYVMTQIGELASYYWVVQSPDLLQGVSETLAGRIQFIDVSGFSLEEIGEDNQNQLWLRGGFPRSYLSKDDRAARRWLEAFAQTFLERDVLSLDPRVSPPIVDRFWRMLAHRHGHTWNTSEIGGSLGMRTRAVNNFHDILLGSFMIRSLPAWFENLGKRLIKSPKNLSAGQWNPTLFIGFV